MALVKRPDAKFTISSPKCDGDRKKWQSTASEPSASGNRWK
jgi:hypothetical protein